MILGTGLYQGFSPHYHLDFHIGIIARGLQRQRFERHNLLLGPTAISFMPPAVTHDGQAEQQQDYLLHTFRVSAACWAESCAEFGLAADGIGPMSLEAPRLSQAFLQWHCAALRRQMKLASQTQWLELVAQLCALNLKTMPALTNPFKLALSSQQMANLSAYCRAELAQAISLDQLAALCAMPRFQFLRAFKQTTGMTPYAWLKRLRLEQACVLLAQVAAGQLSIARLAQEVGFYDQSHFNRAFRQTYGVAPSAY